MESLDDISGSRHEFHHVLSLAPFRRNGVNVVDLARSERSSQALSVGKRLKAGCHRSRSLPTLGIVIRKLSAIFKNPARTPAANEYGVQGLNIASTPTRDKVRLKSRAMIIFRL
ncbi:Kinesin-like protein [Forsythia ovata]|uniref:Kinesin-like protein n=1 Tax=Forsythia ovata TaxID=205694 RepID=A0ABD1X9I7_9LAMI